MALLNFCFVVEFWECFIDLDLFLLSQSSFISFSAVEILLLRVSFKEFFFVKLLLKIFFNLLIPVIHDCVFSFQLS